MVLLLVMGCGTPAEARTPAAVRPALDDRARPTDLRGEGPAQFLTLRDIQERIRRTSYDLVLVHFWATWCPPCMHELSTMSDLARKLPAEGVDVLSISMDRPSRNSAVRVSKVLAQRTQGVLTRAIARYEDPDAFVQGMDPHWEGSIPALLAFAPSGQLVGGIYGEASREEIETFVRNLAAEARARKGHGGPR